MNRKGRKVLRIFLIFFIVWILYQYGYGFYQYIALRIEKKRLEREILYYKARSIVISSRIKYLQTEEGRRKVLEAKLFREKE